MLRITSLASGSSGNAFLVETDGRPLLVEAGLSARSLERWLRQRDVDPATLAGIVVSHEHHDHAQGAGPLARRWNIPVACTTATAKALGAALAGVEILALTADGVTIGDVDVWSFPVPHDASDPQGIILRSGHLHVGWALDLGHVPAHVPAALSVADLVVVEANHDRERLLASRYAWSTKHRIMGDHGHLSNLQAAELIRELALDGRSRTVWLAHLSAQTNDHPQGVKRQLETYLDMAGVQRPSVAIAERDKPSAVWCSEQWVQHGLF